MNHGVCDPLYKRLLTDILDEHLSASKNLELVGDPEKNMTNTALVICNTTDVERGEIEEYLEKRNYAPEMFELDRI